MDPPFIDKYWRIINKQPRSPELRRGSDAKITMFWGHTGLEIDQDGRTGTVSLRVKQGSGVDFLKMINAKKKATIIQEMSVHFVRQLVLPNVWAGNFPGTQPFDLRGF